MDDGNFLNIILKIIAGSGIVSLIFYILQSWGLYMISKKLGDENPWLAWIPILSMYTMVKAGGKSGWWILWIILGFIFFILPGLVLLIMVLHGISERTGRGAGTTIGLIFVPFIMFPVVGYNLKEDQIKKEDIIYEVAGNKTEL